MRRNGLVLVYGGQLTAQGIRLLAACTFAMASLAIFVVGLVLTGSRDSSALGGFLMGLAPSGVMFSLASYRAPRDEQRRVLEAVAERDVLHERLNEIAVQLGLQPLDVAAGEVDELVRQRAERVAHFSGLEEHRTYFFSED